MARRAPVDKQFLILTILLIVGGFFIFTSASLSLLARSSASYSSVAFSQMVLGFGLGSVILYFVSRLDYRVWKKSAFYLLVLAIFLNILVLIPAIGTEHNGARRWLDLGLFSFQPAEVMKFAFIVYFAAWAAGAKSRMQEFGKGFLPLVLLLGILGSLILLQPDTDNFLMMVVAGVAIFLASGGRWKYIGTLFLVGVIILAGLIFTRPYLQERVMTYLNPASADSRGAGWQIRQSLLAIGSGEITGRGFGQSVQKFAYLPEPVGDSIFAVAGEEFGFVGTTLIVLIFTLFALRGLKIASRAQDPFGRLLVVGIVIIITTQAFFNMGSMLGLVPVSGITLPFVSHGGTSLLITLLEVGIILSVSRSLKTN